ncbi:DUF695 domain-containing protein [Arthrobacter echini]|uniref:DUF695 domain-containing protein n=1 Tax=Arthrobacter echini TaxID=1529066 RepID=A0A4S5E9W1_9MICC|nr:DUF695 domain-containing protein [Arthrobacter echini]THJ68458.1 DUF695 domain-containing protein [Arthrobacter echini]
MGRISRRCVRRRGTGRDPISAFWQWWADEGEDLLTTATRDGGFGSHVEVMTRQVQAIARGLEWETRTGWGAEHTLYVSGGADPSLRAVAERWFRASPPAGRRWEFAPARSPRPEMLESTITYRGRTFDLARTRVHANPTRAGDSFIVSVFNPAFTGQWDDEYELCVLLLEWLLGEDDVRRWVRRVDCIVHDVVDSISAAQLPERVADLARSLPRPHWLLLRGTLGSGSPILVRVRRPLRWIDHPRLDLHSALKVPFDADDQGLPAPSAEDMLHSVEQALVRQLGPRGLLVATETSRGVRTLHVYSDSEDRTARDVLDAAARNSRRVSIRHTLDPTWKKVQDFA